MKLLLLLIASGVAWAQPTKIPIGMLQASGSVGCFLGLSPAGVFQCVPIPIPIVPSARLYNVRAASSGADPLVWKLPSAPDPATLEVHRSGLFMLQGLDYTVSGDTITFVAEQGSEPADVIACSYSTMVAGAGTLPVK